MELKIDENLICENETIAVALSGGEDSMSLLFALLDLQKRLPFTLKIINIDHNIRPITSKRDSEFCKNQASRLNIEFLGLSVNALDFAKQNGYTVEQAARILRYNEFIKAIDNGFADKIAVAHHQDDNFETILFNIFRGSGASGAKGMEKSSFCGKIIRPLLGVSKQEIRQYVDYRQIPFVTDETNDDLNYSRNYLRKVIIPQIKERFPSAETATARFAEITKADDDFLFSLAEKQVFERFGDCFVSINCETPVFNRAAILAMKSLGIEKDYCYKHILSLNQLKNSETGKQINLLCNVIAIKEYDKIHFKKMSEKRELESPVKEGIFETDNFKIEIKEISLENYALIEKSRYNAINGTFVNVYFDADKLQDAKLRLIKSGDIFKKIGSGSKSLKQHLVDRKVSKTTREILPVIAKDNNILVICGIEPSLDVAITNETKRIFKLTLSQI